jgi:hypothetical protein
MDFLNQIWFWAILIPAISSLGGILITQYISSKSQIKIVRLKLNESDLFKAYNNLYQFVLHAYAFLWPAGEPQRDYHELMKNSYFKNVKTCMLYFNSEIRDILGELEAQYDCLGDPDQYTEKPFDEFYDQDLKKLLRKLENLVEKRIDPTLYK